MNGYVVKAKKSEKMIGWKQTIRKKARVTPTIPMEEDTWAADTIQVTRTTMTTTPRTSMVSFHTAWTASIGITSRDGFTVTKESGSTKTVDSRTWITAIR